MKTFKLLVPFFIIFVVSAYFISVLPYNYDEFFNLQIPKNIVNVGIYATYYNTEYHLFDPWITTGVSTLLPITLVLSLFGKESPRYLMLIYFIVTCLFLYLVSKKLFGDKVAFVSLLGVIFTPSIIPISLSVLGEIPATLYFLVGIYFLIESETKNSYLYYVLAGVFFAFAVLSKMIFAVLIVSVLLYLVVSKQKALNKITLLISFLIPLFLWELYKIWTLGFKEYGFLRTESFYVSMMQGAPSGLVSTDNLFEKITFLSGSFGLEKIVMINILILYIMFCLYIVFYGFKNRKPILVMYVALILISLSIWYLFMVGIWIRYIIPYIILSIPIIIYLISLLYYEATKAKFVKKYAYSLILILFVWSIGISVSHNIKDEFAIYGNPSMLGVQKRFINDIKTLPSGSTIGYFGWWKAPEISFFVQNDFVDLSGQDSFADFIVVAYYQISMDKGSIEKLSPLFGDEIFEECDVDKNCYYLYKYKSLLT